MILSVKSRKSTFLDRYYYRYRHTKNFLLLFFTNSDIYLQHTVISTSYDSSSSNYRCFKNSETRRSLLKVLFINKLSIFFNIYVLRFCWTWKISNEQDFLIFVCSQEYVVLSSKRKRSPGVFVSLFANSPSGSFPYFFAGFLVYRVKEIRKILWISQFYKQAIIISSYFIWTNFDVYAFSKQCHQILPLKTDK